MLKLTVREKVFNIELVNNYVHQLYADLQNKTQMIIEMGGDLDERRKDFLEDAEENITDRKKVRELKRTFRAEQKEIKAEMKSLSLDMADVREQMLEELCETNKYPYDAEWWLHQTSTDDVNDFVIDCLKKDVKDAKPKKKGT